MNINLANIDFAPGQGVGGPFVAAEVPAADGTYVLKATVQDGEVTYEWIPEV